MELESFNAVQLVKENEITYTPKMTFLGTHPELRRIYNVICEVFLHYLGRNKSDFFPRPSRNLTGMRASYPQQLSLPWPEGINFGFRFLTATRHLFVSFPCVLCVYVPAFSPHSALLRLRPRTGSKKTTTTETRGGFFAPPPPIFRKGGHKAKTLAQIAPFVRSSSTRGV